MTREPSVPLILGDPAQLKQLLLNVLINALEAINTEGRIGIRLAHLESTQQLLVEIADSGPGVPEELLSKMFEAFITTKPEGSGLGLAICRTIADAHHAAIRAENNTSGPGMKIILEFPLLGKAAPEGAVLQGQTLLWT
jgi:two-component system NtrC family sensor kinase